MIDSFTGQYAFLSNFYASEVVLDGLSYSTVEHAFQAAKTFDREERDVIRKANKPGIAKRLGRKVKLRPDWESVKIGVMRDLVRQKFTNHAFLRTFLLDTGNEELVEGNTWNDTFWGVCRGKGKNHLGLILMEVRAELRKES